MPIESDDYRSVDKALVFDNSEIEAIQKSDTKLVISVGIHPPN